MLRAAFVATAACAVGAKVSRLLDGAPAGADHPYGRAGGNTRRRETAGWCARSLAFSATTPAVVGSYPFKNAQGTYRTVVMTNDLLEFEFGAVQNTPRGIHYVSTHP